MSLQVDIKKSFPGFSLDVSFSTDGGILGLLGASGSGKSMALKCIAGIETPDAGRIVLNDRVLFDSEKGINLPPQKRKVGYLFQNYALFPNMTVEENIAAGLTGTRDAKRAAVAEMVELFKLSGLEKRYPYQLSGGQQQRTALARILVYEPDVIMLDEPFSALDYYLKEQVQFQVKEVLKSYKGNALLVTHSRDEVYRFCENSVILNRGSVAMEGPTKTIFERPDNVTAARLTGCKNLSPIKRLDSHRVLALDWGITLETAGEVGDDISFIGIRAHQFYPANGGVNEFSCRWVETLCQPFEWDILLNVTEDENSGETEPVWWKLDANQLKQPENDWLTHMETGGRVRIGIAPEDVLLLKDK